MGANQLPIKVCNVSEEGRGGGQLFCILMMAKAGLPEVETTLILPSSSKQFIQKAKVANIPVRSTLLLPIAKKPIPLLKYLSSFWIEVNQLKILFNELKPDIVQANGSWQYKALIAASQLGIPTVWHLNDTYQPKPVLCLAKFFSRHATIVTYASHASKSYYETIIPRLSLLPNTVIQAPVDPERFIPKEDCIFQEKIKIITTGYININKGFEYVLEVAAQLRDGFEFHICGPVIELQEAYYQTLLKKQKELQLENIIWHGLVEDIPAMLSDMDIYLCASIRESSPMAVWEALSAGLPVVSTDVGDVRLTFEKYDCGLVVPIKDVDTIVDSIRQLTDNQERRKELGKNGALAVEKEFAVETTTNQYLRFLQKQLR